MLSNIPAHGIDEPATKDFVRAEIATVRTEIGHLRDELHQETGGLRTEVGHLRDELHQETGGRRTEFATVRTEIESVRTEIQSTANRIIIWAVGANAAMLGLVLAVTRAT